jgi:predicted Rossmann fold nucleotide-binding protein DprA/Smf involved in DNA uptake
MDIAYLNPDNPNFTPELRKYLADQVPARIAILGNVEILSGKQTAFFCSSKCPGNLIIKTYELAKKWRDDGVTVISGFHSPLERECLKVLLQGKKPVIVCPARSIETMRLKAEFRTPMAEGRLLFLSPFPAKVKRMTAHTGMKRNRFVAVIANDVFVAHAETGGKIEALCRELAAGEKPLTTFAGDSNSNLLALGAQPVTF